MEQSIWRSDVNADTTLTELKEDVLPYIWGINITRSYGFYLGIWGKMEREKFYIIGAHTVNTLITIFIVDKVDKVVT